MNSRFDVRSKKESPLASKCHAVSEFAAVEETEQTLLFGGVEGESRSNSSMGGKTGTGAESKGKPLAVRMRPRVLSEIIGQEHILGSSSLLPRLIKADSFGSILFYGPPGCGKTTLAHVIAQEAKSRFIRLNAVLSNVAEMRDILKFSRARPEDRTILFIDEIHRFNRAQQDLLLPDVEEGNIRLIGATTHNPGFYVISPLLSRSHLFRLEPISVGDILTIMKNALKDTERGLGERGCSAEDSVLSGLAELCDGDLRRALNALEPLVESMPEGSAISHKEVAAFARERQIRYDANEDEHYDTASALIKSMRGGDPNAALYWLAKMLAGGEDPRFIARRIVILASEDVGLADPHALPLAVAAFQACEFIGLPECELNLAHAVVYMATAPKSNSTTEAIGKARKAINEGSLQAVPLHLRDASTKTNRKFGHGRDYRYSHDFPHAITGQEFMEHPLDFYTPKGEGREREIRERLERWKELKEKIQEEEREIRCRSSKIG